MAILNNYFLLKINFKNKPNSKYKYSGTAYYLVNKSSYLVEWERPQLNKKFKFRMNDEKFLILGYQ